MSNQTKPSKDPAALGAAVIEYGELSRQLDDLLERARTAGDALRMVSGYLLSEQARQGWQSSSGASSILSDLNKMPPDGAVKTLVSEIRGKVDRLQTLAAQLADAGVKLA